MRRCETLRSYDWLILTSVNGVKALFERMKKQNLNCPAFAQLKIAAIGPATQEAPSKRRASR